MEERGHFEREERHLKVLIIDDELGLCLGVQKILKSFVVAVENINVSVRFDVHYETTAAQGERLLLEENYDLILLDYKLPEKSGLEILQRWVKEKRQGLVIMVTAYATFETAVMATKLGAYDFVAKPFDPEELRSCIKKAAVRYVLEQETLRFEEEKRKIRFQFISVLSHELKAPLNAIEGYLKILKDRYGKMSESDYDFMLKRSLERTEGMRKLIFDLLDLTRIESGEKQRHLELYDLCPLIYESISLVEEEAKKAEIEIIPSLPQELFFRCDRTEMEIIFNNLISNGVKYNKKGGQLWVNLVQKNDHLCFEVIDTGIGLEEADTKRLFQDFVRIKNQHTLAISGSGLGLSTVKKIANLYGGDVKVKSVVGEGSTFTVYDLSAPE